MSYSLSATSTSKADLHDELSSRIDTALAGVPDEHKDEAAEHLAHALTAIDDLATVLGVDDDLLTVSISGHANTGHTKSARWADEALTISISVHHQAAPA